LAKCDSQNGLESRLAGRRSSVKNCSSSIADIRDDLGQLRDAILAAKTDIRDVSDLLLFLYKILNFRRDDAMMSTIY
jgi:chromosome segregation ATPase